MNARFELVKDDADRVRFRLLGTEGEILLAGLPCSGKIAAQNEVVHARQSMRAADHFVHHMDKHGRHFAVLKDDDGSVLGRSCAVALETELDKLIAHIQELGEDATIVDRTRSPRRTAG